MHGLEDGALVADVPRGGEPQATDQARTHVREDVAVEVGHDEDFVVVGGGVCDDLEAGVVEEFGVEFYIGEVLGDAPSGVEEEAVGHLHDGGFVHGADFSFAHVFGVLEGEAEDALGGFASDEFYGLDDPVDDNVLDAGVFAFGVLPNEHRIDVVIGSFVAGNGFAGTDVGEEVEGAA